MNTTVTMTLDEVINIPLTQEEIQTIHNAAAKSRTEQNSDTADCPKQSKEELENFHLLKDIRPDLYARLHFEPQNAGQPRSVMHI